MNHRLVIAAFAAGFSLLVTGCSTSPETEGTSVEVAPPAAEVNVDDEQDSTPESEPTTAPVATEILANEWTDAEGYTFSFTLGSVDIVGSSS